MLDQHHTEDLKVSFVLFDEIEKASDALWNLLLGILDKATLTLGDNRRVDFSRALIFMTSNLGASEMSAMMNPEMGFAGRRSQPIDFRSGKISKRIVEAGMTAARKKFTPEFMNRLNKIVVFKTLGEQELRQILELELSYIQQRVFNGTPFLFQLTGAAKEVLLDEGTDAKYGARHLKRSIERSLVYPMANLVATEQIQAGDLIEVDYDAEHKHMLFERTEEDLPVYAMFRAAGIDMPRDLELENSTLGALRRPAGRLDRLTRT